MVGGEPIIIPPGFETDGASIPWGMRWRFCPWGRCGAPAVVHDGLLQRGALPKWQIDWIFCGLLQADGVADLRAGLSLLAFARGQVRDET